MSGNAPSKTSDEIRAIVCDVDGCLSPEAMGPADTATLAQLADHSRMARAGRVPPLSLCTGRPLPFADAMARVVGATTLPTVCEGGVWLLDPVRYRWTIDPSITESDLAALRELRRWIGGAFGGVSFEEGKTAAITVFHTDGPSVLERDVLGPLRERVKEAGLALRVSMTWTCINVEPAGVSKATGIDRMLAETGLKAGELAGVGDTMADLGIRERVRLFCCPSNAKEELKAHADYVSPYEEARGVADILAWLESHDGSRGGAQGASRAGTGR